MGSNACSGDGAVAGGSPRSGRRTFRFEANRSVRRSGTSPGNCSRANARTTSRTFRKDSSDDMRALPGIGTP